MGPGFGIFFVVLQFYREKNEAFFGLIL